MDTLLEGFPGSITKFKFGHGSVSVMSNHHNRINLANGFKFVDQPFILPTNSDQSDPPSSDSNPSSGLTSDGESSSPEQRYYPNSTMLKFISEILMEEDLEGKPCMMQDCLALQAAEKSFYDVLGQNYPPPSPSPDQNHPYFDQNVESPDHSFCQSSSNSNTAADNLVPIPSPFDQESNQSVPPEPKEESRGMKNHQREEDKDCLEDSRSNKQTAVFAEEPEPQEMFDKVLLCRPPTDNDSVSCAANGANGKGNGQSKGANGKTTTRQRKRGNGNNKGEIVDLWSLLTQCAQAVASNDQRISIELLKQIRQHSSPYGDGTQRLAHYFAIGLDARLATQTPLYLPFVGNEMSAADILKGYQVFVSSCPFKAMSNFYANRTILKLAEKATRLHIIDFGILYGFQWPCLIQRLSTRHGGPPKLRITGIEFPQPGFRPVERVEETGRRLANYCKRFNVPFEWNVIAQKWDTIQLENLKLERDELVVVNCLNRLKNVPDETVAFNSPRDNVLKLIKRINPDLFIHGIANGTYNTPFFTSRFREALFHFSALFDMFEATVPREDQQRVVYEKVVFGRDAINVIACEGSERVERPETYKQWRIRNLRAGFSQQPLDQKLLNEVKKMVKLDYHQDFVVDNDGQWMLQGWKGRIVQALSCWKPARD